MSVQGRQKYSGPEGGSLEFLEGNYTNLSRVCSGKLNEGSRIIEFISEVSCLIKNNDLHLQTHTISHLSMWYT